MADFGAKKWSLMIVMVLMGVVVGERTENCDMLSSPNHPNMLDVHCNCMQRLKQTDLNINQLTINQTGCTQTGLELNWPDLESLVAPNTLILEGAEVYFARRTRPATPWISSIQKIKFLDCHFEVLPSHAFKGLKKLEEVKFERGSVGIVKSNAFNSLPVLARIEIENVTLNVIESRAFSELPEFKGLFIVNSRIKLLENNAVSLIKPLINDDIPACTEDITRNSFNTSTVLDDVMGRSLNTVANLSLPEFGTKILLFKNTIEVVSPGAITSDIFGFLIIGGNYIGRIGAQAFDMQLYNECDVTAALFVGNTIAQLDTSAIAGLRRRDGLSYQTFIALSNNTFLNVLPQGFMLHRSMEIFSIEENRFECTCGKFDWILGNNEASELQQDLEKELALEGLCQDGSKLISFTSFCDTHDSTGLPVSSTVLPVSSTVSPVPSTDSSVSTSTNKPSSAVGNSATFLCVMTLVLGVVLY